MHADEANDLLMVGQYMFIAYTAGPVYWTYLGWWHRSH